MGNFQNLHVWLLAKDIAVKIYRLTAEQEFSKDFGLKDQIQRAAVSIACNIAEGDESGSNKQSVKYFYFAKGSTAELITQLVIANEINYIGKDSRTKLIDECLKVSAMLNNLIKARKAIR